MVINCKHWHGRVRGGGKCSSGQFHGSPSHSCCLTCTAHELRDATKPLSIESPEPPQPAPAATPAIPRELWPKHIAAIAKCATEADKGIGDTVKRLWADGTIYQRMQAAGIIINQRGAPDTLKAVEAMLTGHDCGCADVQKRLNQLYPLTHA